MVNNRIIKCLSKTTGRAFIDFIHPDTPKMPLSLIILAIFPHSEISIFEITVSLSSTWVNFSPPLFSLISSFSGSMLVLSERYRSL